LRASAEKKEGADGDEKREKPLSSAHETGVDTAHHSCVAKSAKRRYERALPASRVTLVLRNNTMKFMRSNSLTNYTRTTKSTNGMRTMRPNTSNISNCIPQENNCGQGWRYGDDSNKDRNNWQVLVLSHVEVEEVGD
jgi:hypothetical protein